MVLNLDIIHKSGAWYSYNEERLGQGRENAKVFLKENPDIRNEIMLKIRDHYGLDTGRAETEDTEEISLLKTTDALPLGFGCVFHPKGIVRCLRGKGQITAF